MYKFRVWDKKLKQFCEFYGEYRGQFDLYRDGVLKNANSARKEDDFVFQLYSGFKDRNGQEICEGDILCYSPTYEDFCKGDDGFVSVVEFKNGCFQTENDFLYDLAEGGILEQEEIVGNIFENKDLLE